MAAIKPSIPKGTRDFGPAEVHRRQYILNTIREVFELYGFQPIETPAMEQMSTLTGKYGEEGDKLLFRILNSGDYLSKADEEALKAKDSNGLAPTIAEKGLRYDLTIPFARFVVQHQNDITFPFRRYQMQPVWRADRPQKGRYREFWQCDADVIGSDSLVSEVELVEIYLEVFRRLKIPVTVKINHRKVLFGIAEYFGATDRFSAFTGSLDKIDKQGYEAAEKELIDKGLISLGSIESADVGGLSHFREGIQHRNKGLKGHLEDVRKEKFESSYYNFSSKSGIDGMNDLIEITALLTDDTNVKFNPYLARGLDYYTGTILEVTANNVEIGSIGGGGRYDNLTGVFGLPGISGVGISFGLDRIYDVLEATGGFPEQAAQTTQALVVRFEDAPLDKLMEITRYLRQSGIRAEIYPDTPKLKKQFKYADQNHIPWVITAGPEELSKEQVGLKNMVTGEQNALKLAAAMEQIKAARQAS